MRILIIEDELAAAARLEKILTPMIPDFCLQARLDSVEESIEWLLNHPAPDLMFMDIQLSDGLCFEIFEHVPVQCPIIFTTAFDEYVMKAFKLNSVDYLLKPVNLNDLETALNKFYRLKDSYPGWGCSSLQTFIRSNSMSKAAYRSRFMVKKGSKYRVLSVHDIRYFFINRRLVFVKTALDEQYCVDSTLDEIEKVLDPELFFRINRQMMVCVSAIQSAEVYFNSRLILKLEPEYQSDAIVSREKIAAFKQWIDS